MGTKTPKQFTRSFSQNLRDLLEEQRPLWDKLRKDIEAGEVFPAIRNEEMHFYHKGGRLLAFNKGGFRTNVKYTLALHDEYSFKGDIFEKKLSCIEPVPNFAAGYKSMKEHCTLYAGKEAAAIAVIYAKSPYTLCCPKENAATVVVLDIEVSLAADIRESETDKQDRIDLVLLDTRSRELLFVEAKLFANGAIRAKTNCRPKVVGQIKNYRHQVAERKHNMIAAYAAYTESVNALLDLNVPVPTSIIEEVPLLIVDFDDDQRKGRLKQNIRCLQEDHKVCCLPPIGNTGSASDQTLKSWFTQVKRFRGTP